MTSSEPLTAAVLNDRAIALFESGDWDGADRAWYHAYVLDPEHWETALNSTLAAWRRGHTTDWLAVRSFESDCSAQNGAWPTVYALGLIHLERRDLAQAVPLLEEAARRSALDLGFEPLLKHVREAGGVERVAEVKIDRPPASKLPIALAGEALVLLVGEGHDVVLRRAHDLSARPISSAASKANTP